MSRPAGDIITIAVLSTIITAPLGSVALNIACKRFLADVRNKQVGHISQ